METNFNREKNCITKPKNNQGFSLVEMIIVIAMIGILAGLSVGMIGYLRTANTKKIVENIGSTLTKMKTSAMSSGDNETLYIYHLTDGYYLLKSSGPTPALGTSGEKIASDNTKLYAIDDSGNRILVNGSSLVDGTNSYIMVGYSRTGLFSDTNTNVSGLFIEGGKNYTITFALDTGKYFVE